MSETFQIIVGIILLVGVYILTQMAVGYRIKRAAKNIVRELDLKKAHDDASAIDLPYAKANMFRIGLRDFRPKAIDALVKGGIVGITAAGKYYLKKRRRDLTF
jgi:hypothetical protein